MVTLNKLSSLQIRNANGPARLQDGGGLSLRVRKSGSKSWVFAYRWKAERPEIGLGSWPSVSLAGAREKAEQARKWLASSPKLDPRAEWKKLERARDVQQTQISFGAFAETFIGERSAGWKNRDHEKQWRGSLKKHARPIWETPIGTVTSVEVLNCLKPIWYEIPTTAKRIMGRMELVFDAARAEGLIEGANPATWKGNLQAALPKLKR
ncbi:MAG: DUF4102 domain-containing protein, partial [Alphaproteobacteria bacterium]|nr:DUF4102 domain-containing protein [Alphaproteobacteria bacterium]